MEREIRKITELENEKTNIYTVGNEFAVKGVSGFKTDRITKDVSVHFKDEFDVFIPVYNVYVSHGKNDFLWKTVNANNISSIEFSIPESILNSNE